MVVNGSKTTLMCVTAASSYQASAEICDVAGNKIKSLDTAKFLGVTLDSNCTWATQVNNVQKKIRSRSWTLNTLRQSGFSDEELVKVYCRYIRPLAEYASQAWGKMLTQDQARALERQQNQSLKNIFGLGISAEKMRSRAGIETLQERRRKALEKFARKNLESRRFGHWFMERRQMDRGREGVRRTYEEPISRIDRHWNSPLNTMRRILNGH